MCRSGSEPWKGAGVILWEDSVCGAPRGNNARTRWVCMSRVVSLEGEEEGWERHREKEAGNAGSSAQESVA